MPVLTGSMSESEIEYVPLPAKVTPNQDRSGSMTANHAEVLTALASE